MKDFENGTYMINSPGNAGQVCTSAGAGRGVWQNLNLPTNLWTANANGIDFEGGNVGIGTSIPSEQLEICNGGLSVRGRNSHQSLNGFQNLIELQDPDNAAIVYRPDQNRELMFGFHSDNHFYWGSKNSDGTGKYAMNLSKDGWLATNVTGSNAPIQAFTVDAETFGSYENAVNSYFFKATDGGNPNNTFIIRGDGNVGIGTDQPQAKLDVNGNSIFRDYTSYYKDMFLIGEDAVNSSRDINFQYANAGKAMIRSHRGGSWDTYLQFWTSLDSNIPQLQMQIDANGNVGIGTGTKTLNEKLEVDGTVLCKRVNVTLTGWPDYVFVPDYPLMPISELGTFIRTNKHLPGIASEKEVLEKGLDLGDSNAALLQKIEELSLYIIQLNKRIEILEKK
jgi:hypothetical protein